MHLDPIVDLFSYGRLHTVDLQGLKLGKRGAQVQYTKGIHETTLVYDWKMEQLIMIWA
jgi:hypothetical protein